MLEEISKRIKGSYLVLAGSATRAGLRDIIADMTPRILLIDELDKVVNSSDLSVLLSWMQSQRIIITMHGRYEVVECPYEDGCKVIAAANSMSKIPREILSRFIRINIPEYTPEQVRDICVTILSKQGVSKEVAEYISVCVTDKLRSRDPRDCVKIASMMSTETKEEVDQIVSDILGT